MGATAITIRVGQTARAAIQPLQAGKPVSWPGGRPQWSANNGNIHLRPEVAGMQADIQGVSPGTTVVTVTGNYSVGPQSQPLQATVTVTVVSADPQPDDFGIVTVIKPG
jgi:hypothetical protein